MNEDMTEDLNHQNLSADTDSAILYELFEEALHLHDTGNSYEPVLTRCPQLLRQELQKQVEGATSLQHVAKVMVRPRNQEVQSAQRAEFLQAVRAMGGRSAITTPQKSLLDQITDAIQGFLDKLNNAIPQFSPRFSPALAMIALLLIGSVGVGTAAAQSLPGDRIYPVKEFYRDTQEAIALPSRKEEVAQQNEMALREDNAQAAIKRPNVITVTQELKFYQKGDSVWSIGGQTVLPGYPVESNAYPGGIKPMELVGVPQPEDLVRLTYQIMPGKPNLIYGVRLEVIPPVPPQVIPVAVATAVVIVCEPNPPPGWIVYRIQRGDLLGSLAVRSGTDVAMLKSVNCQTTDVILAGGTIFTPDFVDSTNIPAHQPVYALPTSVPTIIAPVATATEAITPDIEASPTSEFEATATAVIVDASGDGTGSVTPTVEEASTEESSTEGPTEVATDEVVKLTETPSASTDTPVPDATFTPTPEPTGIQDGTSATATATSVTAEPETETPVTATSTPEPSTQTPSPETPDDQGTPTDVETPTGGSTPTGAAIPTDEIVPTDTAIPLDTVEAEPATVVPVETPTVESSGGDDTNSAQATVSPEATLDIATPVATAEPPPDALSTDTPPTDAAPVVEPTAVVVSTEAPISVEPAPIEPASAVPTLVDSKETP